MLVTDVFKANGIPNLRLVQNVTSFEGEIAHLISQYSADFGSHAISHGGGRYATRLSTGNDIAVCCPPCLIQVLGKFCAAFQLVCQLTRIYYGHERVVFPLPV